MKFLSISLVILGVAWLIAELWDEDDNNDLDLT